MNQTSHQSTVEIVTNYAKAERKRWRKQALLLLLLGLMISVLVHYFGHYILSNIGRNRSGNTLSSNELVLEFAVMETSEFSELQSDPLENFEPIAPTEASAFSSETSQATLAPVPGTRLEAASGSVLSGGALSNLTSISGAGSSGSTSFFGVSSSGSRFCYIVDVSSSMKDGGKLDLMRDELIRSITGLPDFSKFYVLFFSTGFTEPQSQRGWLTARKRIVDKIVEEISRISAAGGTAPKEAFVKAFSLNPLPDVIYFLTDGAISGFTAEDLKELMPAGDRVVIHSIAFGSSDSQDLLKEFSKMTGGEYKFKKPDDSP